MTHPGIPYPQIPTIGLPTSAPGEQGRERPHAHGEPPTRPHEPPRTPTNPHESFRLAFSLYLGPESPKSPIGLHEELSPVRGLPRLLSNSRSSAARPCASAPTPLRFPPAAGVGAEAIHERGCCGRDRGSLTSAIRPDAFNQVGASTTLSIASRACCVPRENPLPRETVHLPETRSDHPYLFPDARSWFARSFIALARIL